MDWVIGAGTLLLVPAAMWMLVVVARRVRRRGTAGQALAAAMAAYDEGFHATAYDSFIEVRSAHERGEQAPAPGSPRRRSSGREIFP